MSVAVGNGDVRAWLPNAFSSFQTLKTADCCPGWEPGSGPLASFGEHLPRERLLRFRAASRDTAGLEGDQKTLLNGCFRVGFTELLHAAHQPRNLCSG